MALFAIFIAGNVDLFIDAVHRIFKVDFQRVTEVFALLRSIGVLPSAAAEKVFKAAETAAETAAAEELAEDILCVESAGIGSAAASVLSGF